MIIPTAVMGVIAVTLFLIARFQGHGGDIAGIKAGMLLMAKVLPLLFFAFITAGMIQTVLPKDLMLRWVGHDSGFRGILIGSIAGSLAPGGPYISMPIAAGLLKAGAGIGTMVAFMTGWSLLALNRFPIEVGLMGWRFTLVRLATTFFFPPIAGYLAQLIFSGRFRI